MVKRGLIISNSEEGTEGKRNHCEFHNREGHGIQECTEFRAIVQNLMDNKEMEFYEEIEGSEEREIYASEEGSMEKVQKGNRPLVIILKPRVNEARTQVAPRVIIQKPAAFPYRDSKRVPWNYDCNVPIQGKDNPASASKEDQNPASISVLALLQSSEVHRNTLMKVLNETYMANDISVSKLDQLVNNISADNFIYFNDDEIPPGGRGSTKALHITSRCKGYTLLGVLIDNGSTLNVLPISTLNRLPVDSSHMKECQNIVRAFDGTQRRVMGRIEIPLLIGPTTYEVDFLVMVVKPSYNCLLGRPWIHSAGAVPSSLHQKLKLVSEGRLVTINTEEDIIAAVTSDAPYLETNDEAIKCSFRSLEFVNATFITEGNRILVPKISKTTRMGLQMTVGKGALPGKGLRRYLQGELWLRWVIHAEQKAPIEEDIIAMLGNVHINVISEEAAEGGSLLDIRPYEPGSVLNNWTAEEIPIVFRAISEFPDINDMSNAATGSESPFEQDMCLEGSQDFENDMDCGLSSDLLRMVKQEERQILPHEETMEVVTLEEGKAVKIGTCITEEMKRDLVDLLQEFKDVFAWSYQDMPRLSTDIIVHRLPIKQDCKPVQQKLRRMGLDIVLKIKEDVKKQFDAGFLQEIKYSEWVANIVPVPKKDGATYQRAMVTLFHDMIHKEIEVYVDDMIVKFRTEEEHIRVLRKLFLRRESRLTPTRFELYKNCLHRAFKRKSEVSWEGLNYIARFISQLTEKSDPIFRLLKKRNLGVWDDECQNAFDKVKQYLSSPPVLFPPRPDGPLILYLTVFNNSMGCVLSQHDESGRREKAIYYLSKKFTECEMRYSPVEKLCCALIRTTQRLRQYMLYHMTWLISKLDPLKYMMESTALNGRMTRWQILLSEFDIVYVSQKDVKGSAIADFLASRALEEYEPLNSDFPNEELMYVSATEEDATKDHLWKLNFDGASKAIGNGIGAVLVSPNGDHYPFSCKLDFDCTNNMAEYEACIMGLRAAIERPLCSDYDEESSPTVLTSQVWRRRGIRGEVYEGLLKVRRRMVMRVKTCTQRKDALGTPRVSAC
ncbi:RNA-directed DNA polymerase (Reverse transcriptase), Ribonuclease H [Gossypium australe]|uniref:RNA-directed DNA polymerase n=1 Tax=Gossypium australe TaxID=47621 RepID=A0A5B6V4M2_9ROSI|nr:RNA-directed DNA polymerase (Reverse transcriptase), Ribonuclease H [Gossypium australe]